MINRLLTLFLVPVLLSCLLACPRSVLAQKTDAKNTDPQNVLDYYLLLPKEELSMLENMDKPRQSLIKTMNVPNGYLALRNDELQGGTQIALFRKKDRGVLIAVSQTEETVASTGSVKFLRYQGGKWDDVTADVLPTVADKEILAAYNRIKKGDDEARTLQHMPSIYWELPQVGTTVEMRCGEDSDAKGKPLLRFAWNGTHFTRQAKP